MPVTGVKRGNFVRVRNRSRKCTVRKRLGEIGAAAGIVGIGFLLLFLLCSGVMWGRGMGRQKRWEKREVQMQEIVLSGEGTEDGGGPKQVDRPGGNLSSKPDPKAIQDEEEARMYRDFLGRMEKVRSRQEMGEMGFTAVEEQVFPFEMDGVGEVFLIPAMDRESRRLVLFFADAQGEMVFRTERLKSNRQIPGSFRQANRDVVAVSFPDIDGDGRRDVVLITLCSGWEDKAGSSYKVGDVLFQGQGSFYQDWRLSDRINRFGMNKSVKLIVSFVREGDLAESLYRAASLEELKSHGFVADEGHSFKQNFEKLGELLAVPGYYTMAEYHICMVCLANEQGNVVWSAQPMGEFENLYEILGIDSRDIDGDGLKDLTVMARYTYDSSDGEMMKEKDYTIYYQRTGGFLEDTEFKSKYQCTEETTMEDLVELARSYWGWGTEND